MYVLIFSEHKNLMIIQLVAWIIFHGNKIELGSGQQLNSPNSRPDCHWDLTHMIQISQDHVSGNDIVEGGEVYRLLIFGPLSYFVL